MPLPYYFFVLSLIVLCLAFVLSVYLNRNKEHRFFHRIPHQLKFVTLASLPQISDNTRQGIEKRKVQHIMKFSEGACDEVAILLEKLFGRKGFGCCIRWATKDKQKYCFVTMGRSQSVNNSARQQNTTFLYLESDNEEKGLAYHLTSSNRKVLMLTDIGAADIIRDRIWIGNEKCDSEKSIQSLMAFPINIIIKEESGRCRYEMAGILYFTSNRKGWMSPFNSQFVEFGSMVADTLAGLYPRVNTETYFISPDR